MAWTLPSIFTSPKNPKTELRDGQGIILKPSWKLDSCKHVESEMYHAADGLFGTPTVLCSYEGTHPTGEPISNRLFLPTSFEIKSAHWGVLAPYDSKLNAESRTLCYTLSTATGISLVHAKSSYELCIAVVHSMLGMYG